MLKNSNISEVIEGLLNSFNSIFWSFSIEDSIFYDFFKFYIRNIWFIWCIIIKYIEIFVLSYYMDYNKYISLNKIKNI